MGKALEKLLDGFNLEVVDPDVSGISDVGLVRVLNEDNWGCISYT